MVTALRNLVGRGLVRSMRRTGVPLRVSGAASVGGPALWPSLAVSAAAHAALLGTAFTWNPWAASSSPRTPIRLEVVTRSTRSAAADAAIESPAAPSESTTNREQSEPEQARHGAEFAELDRLEARRGMCRPASDAVREPGRIATPETARHPIREPNRPARAESPDVTSAAMPRRSATPPASAPSTGIPMLAEPGADRRYLPRPRSASPPAYPARALQEGWEGRIEVVAVLDRKGNVVRARIHRSSGHAILDDAALKWVRSLSFDVEPLWFVQRVERAIRVPVRFEIRE